ncbi:MAG TPA: PRC-barrel domain-containing protein [Candidatus Didemnitutus sp.]|nr:PRC-barrel domain-containing protein [Candidatus Didemnitutus sp.]
MLHYTRILIGQKLAASDGEIGHVKDFLYDDLNWVLRYLVVDTGNWLVGRSVLIAPQAIGSIEIGEKALPVKLRRSQIERAPALESHLPVSRQYEIDYYQYYGWPAYWAGGELWGLGAVPTTNLPPPILPEKRVPVRHRSEKHLQSVLDTVGYRVEGLDGDVGRLEGFLFDDHDWAVAEVVIEAGHWYAGHEVRVSRRNIRGITHEHRALTIDLRRADIQRAREDEIARHPGEPLPRILRHPRVAENPVGKKH